jgi:hypothetical protein
MVAAPKAGRLLSLLTCGLVIAASGDDFNFARLVVPSMFAGGASLPLDDPNADFDGTLNEAWGQLGCRGQANPSNAGILPSLFCWEGHNLSESQNVLLPCHGRFPLLELNPPLLC